MDKYVLSIIMADKEYFRLHGNRTYYILLLAVYYYHDSSLWTYKDLQDRFTAKQFVYASRYLLDNGYITKINLITYKITDKGIKFCTSYIAYLQQ